MKIILAMFLTAALVLCCLGACAEEAVKLNENSDSIDFYINVTNGMALDQSAYDPGTIGSMEVAGMSDLIIFLSLMPDDSFDNIDMNNLSDADMTALMDFVSEDMGEVTHDTYSMPCGLTAMTVLDTGKTEYISITLKDGYFFYMLGFHDDFSTLSDDEIAAVKAAFDSLSYEEIAQ